MERGLVATASIAITAPVPIVWDVLVNPDLIKQYMFGTTVVSEWKEGGPIVWKGEWQGRTYEVTRRSKRASTPKRTGEWCSRV